MSPGAIILNRLRELGDWQASLAAAVGISPQYVNDLIRDRRRPAPDVAEAIFDALDLPPLDRLTCIDGWTDPIMEPWNALRARSVPTITLKPTP